MLTKITIRNNKAYRQFRMQIFKSVFYHVKDQVWDQVIDTVWEQIWNRVWDQIGDMVYWKAQEYSNNAD